MMARLTEAVAVLLLLLAVASGCYSTHGTGQVDAGQGGHGFVAPGEFEPQEYIWLSWNEAGFLGGPSFSGTLLELMRVLTPHVKGRAVIQIDATPMLHDGAGIHCWSRNQPYAVGEPRSR